MTSSLSRRHVDSVESVTRFFLSLVIDKKKKETIDFDHVDDLLLIDPILKTKREEKEKINFPGYLSL